MLAPELAALVEANAWTYGPNATALRVLRLTIRSGADPAPFWESLLQACPRMAPLGYWRELLGRGSRLEDLEPAFLRRQESLLGNLLEALRPLPRILIVGHDCEVDDLLRAGGHEYRYLLVDGPPGSEPPGAGARTASFRFDQIEEALDWADGVLLAGFVIHRQNVLGPSQLRPLLSSARDQTDGVYLCATNERRLTLGEGAPRGYREDFRPYLWQSSVTSLVSEWHRGTEGTHLGWFPYPAGDPA